MQIEVSDAEILDKLSILEIKYKYITQKNKLINISKELNYLKNISEKLISIEPIKDLYIQLKNINEQLWNIEDSIRKKEKIGIFDQEFIELARKVYIINDHRSEIKKTINIINKSNFIEEKSYNK